VRRDLRRPPPPRRPSLTAFAYWLVGFFVIYGAQSIGWGFTGLVLVIAAYAIAYAWKRFRPHSRSGTRGEYVS
jgi:hypothetical protein